MENEKAFNCVIVDTSAFDGKNNDFAGVFNEILPSFFKMIADNNIQLLAHQILLEETRKHISDENEGYFNKAISHAITAITKHQLVLKEAEIKTDELIKKLKSLPLSAQSLSAFERFFSMATMLPFGDPQKVFESYFSAKPPFAQTGNKKAEFPDAFVIQSLTQFLDKNPRFVVLVVTGDNDWVKALDANEKIVLCNNIDEAVKKINKQTLQVKQSVIQQINSNVSTVLFIERLLGDKESDGELWFSLPFYEIEFEDDNGYSVNCTVEDYCITQLHVDNISDSIILNPSFDNGALGKGILQATITLLIDANFYLSAIDEATSDHEAVYVRKKGYKLNVKNATCHVRCSLPFEINNNTDIRILDLKVHAENGVELQLDDFSTNIYPL